MLDGVPDHLLVVDLGLGGDLAADHDHAGLGHGLAGDLSASRDTDGDVVTLHVIQIVTLLDKRMTMYLTLLSGSSLRWASSTASLIWSHILSGERNDR